MVACLLCSVTASLGRLCTAHGVAIASAGLTSEQLISKVSHPAPASLVDPWGYGHPVGARTVVGRDLASADLALLHASISGSSSIAAAVTAPRSTSTP
jgi:hypothetical protein